MIKLLFILLFSIYANGSDESPKWSIVDIYAMAQRSTVTNLNYPLYHQMLKKDRWVSITTAWNTFIDATVDEKNDYIYILDEGTGGGSFSTQAAMWKDDAGGILLIVSENGYNFIFPEKSLLKAFEYMPISGDAASLGIRLVDPPMKNISLLDFVPKTMSMKDLQMLKQLHPTIFYKLPREGTSIHVLLVIEDEFRNQSILKECFYDDKSTCKKMQKIYRYYYQNLKGKIYRDIELGWREYHFSIISKSKKEPTIKDIWIDK